jgi:hypothetical protein
MLRNTWSLYYMVRIFEMWEENRYKMGKGWNEE